MLPITHPRQHAYECYECSECHAFVGSSLTFARLFSRYNTEIISFRRVNGTIKIDLGLNFNTYGSVHKHEHSKNIGRGQTAAKLE
jgi:hypothetical protein